MPADAFQELWGALHAMRDGLRTLALTVAQDHPPVRAVPEPVRRATDDVEDLLGLLQEAVAAIAPCVEAGARERRAAAGCLRACHDRLIALGRAAGTGLACPDRLGDLAAVVADRADRAVPWRRWHASVLAGLGGCGHALWDAHAAVLNCWDDLSPTRSARPLPAGAHAAPDLEEH